MSVYVCVYVCECIANTCEITDDGAEMIAVALMGKYEEYINTK